jgi:(S)-3,5-dihydroxyphenylglycine transaminase
MKLDLNPALRDPQLDVMNFLNQVMSTYPKAISFGPGRPATEFADIQDPARHIERYIAHRAAQRGVAAAEVRASLGQYGRTNGVIGDLIARHLELDYQIRVDPAAVMVTCGAQEAMAIVLQGLFDRDRDVLLVTDPNYVGMTGACRILGIRVQPVAVGDQGVELASVLEGVAAVRAAGLRPRALYDVPDFHNPLATTVPLEVRHELLALASAQDLLLIEDNPYGTFAFDAAPLPTLKSLDRDGRVLYIGTFSKTLLPGVRIGYLVADQHVQGAADAGPPVLLADELSKVKSLLTVNTSPILQAIVGGRLLEQDCTLRASAARMTEHYRRKRDRLLAALGRELGAGTRLAGKARWRTPAGGFFLNVETPFPWSEQQVAACARDYGVIVTPMRCFSMRGADERWIRLSFSSVELEQIDEGVRRLARFLQEVVEHG